MAVDLVKLRRVADAIEAFGLRRIAAELREEIDRAPDERPCPIQDAPGGQVRAIPWGLAERLYVAYGHDQTLERLAQRGGFARSELGMLAVGMYTPPFFSGRSSTAT